MDVSCGLESLWYNECELRWNRYGTMDVSCGLESLWYMDVSCVGIAMVHGCELCWNGTPMAQRM